MAVEVHSAQASPTTYANLVESHNDYVQQLHAANGMVDQVSSSFKPYKLDVFTAIHPLYKNNSKVVLEKRNRPKYYLRPVLRIFSFVMSQAVWPSIFINQYRITINCKSFCVFQYYAETLPLLLQELDDVYHDVSAVVAETMIQV